MFMSTAVINRFDSNYRFLSNFWYSKVLYNGLQYKSVEHAFQAQKACIKMDHDLIQASKTPSEAKKLGRRVVIRSDWDNIKIKIMTDLLRSKFPVPELQAKLVYTENATLIEGNYWHNNYWGVCYCEKCFNILEGKNQLGKLLMSIREEFKT